MFCCSYEDFLPLLPPHHATRNSLSKPTNKPQNSGKTPQPPSSLIFTSGALRRDTEGKNRWGRAERATWLFLLKPSQKHTWKRDSNKGGSAATPAFPQEPPLAHLREARGPVINAVTKQHKYSGPSYA